MKKETLSAITGIISMDTTISPEKRDAILKCCSDVAPKRRLLSAKEAMAILGIARPTLREYVKHGIIEQINISSRKVRFDAAQVENLAYRGR